MFKAATGAIISTLVVVSLYYLPVVDVYVTFYSLPLLNILDQGGFDPWLFLSPSLAAVFGFLIALVVIMVGRMALEWAEILPPVLIPGIVVGILAIIINGHDPMLLGVFFLALTAPFISIIFLKRQGKETFHDKLEVVV